MKAKIQVTTLSIILWIIFLLAIKLIYSNWFLNHAIAGIVVLFVLFGTMFYVNNIRDTLKTNQNVKQTTKSI